MSQENTETVTPAAQKGLQGETIGEVTGMMEDVMKKYVMAISARDGRLQGETIKCRKNKDLTF